MNHQIKFLKRTNLELVLIFAISLSLEVLKNRLGRAQKKLQCMLLLYINY